ncbi:hypothetical protein B0H13DRAFT_2380120 [Mycena leptocephala]|nr:hypothetical protein B0H13DRAFT_2380120 [Mycena leptocephala]
MRLDFMRKPRRITLVQSDPMQSLHPECSPVRSATSVPHAPDRETRSAADGDIEGRPGIPKPLRSSFFGPSAMVQGPAEDFIPYMCPQVTRAGNSSASAGSHVSPSSRNTRSTDTRASTKTRVPGATQSTGNVESSDSQSPHSARTHASSDVSQHHQRHASACAAAIPMPPRHLQIGERRSRNRAGTVPVSSFPVPSLVWVGLAFGGGVGALEDGVVFVCVEAGRRAYRCRCAESAAEPRRSEPQLELVQAISTRYRANSSMARLEEDFSDLRTETHSRRERE